MHNKRGQGLSTTAIILIVLGVFVLVVLIVGFILGWDTFAFWLPSNNVDTIIQQCGIACSTNSVYNYCTDGRELKADKTLKDVTCYYLSEKQTSYGIEKCSSISCDQVFVELTGEEVLSDKCVGNEGKTIQALIANKLESHDCPALSP